MPAHALRVLCTHGSGQLSQRVAHPFPSWAAHDVIRHDGRSCCPSAHLVLEAELPPTGGIAWFDGLWSQREAMAREEESDAKLGVGFFKPYTRASRRCRIDSRA